MRRYLLSSTVALAAALAAGCKSADAGAVADDLPQVAEIDLVSPAEAAALAETQITEANVDAEYDKLLSELGS